MKRMHTFLFYILCLCAGSTLFGMNQQQHPALAAFHKTYFLKESNEFHVKNPLFYIIITPMEAFIFIEHEVAPGNSDPFAQSFCTCLCYLMTRNLMDPQQFILRGYNTVPRKHKMFVHNLIKAHNLAPLRPGLSPNLTLLTAEVLDNNATMQLAINNV